MASVSVESAVIAAIKPHFQPALKDRITPMKRDDSGLYPAIVYESGLPERETLLDGSQSAMATAQMQFTIFAKTYSVAKEWQSTLATVLNGLRGQINPDISILGARVVGVAEQNESDVDNLYSTSIAVTIWFK